MWSVLKTINRSVQSWLTEAEKLCCNVCGGRSIGGSVGSAKTDLSARKFRRILKEKRLAVEALYSDEGEQIFRAYRSVLRTP